MTTKTPSILIAGGAGFIGSHLCDHYCERQSVVCVDNLSTGRQQNIAHLFNRPNFSFVEADVVRRLPESILQHQYTTVVNLASPASPPRYQELSLETLAVGSEGTRRLLELARRDNARFFHASTSEVYGDPEVHPQSESYWGHVNSYGPRSMYDEAKRYGEALIYAYRQRYGLSTAIARIFNTYGPRMDPEDGRVVSNLVVQALRGEPLTIYGDGSQTRSFCYISDLVRGIVKLIDSTEEGPINLGNPEELTINELATKVKTAINRPIETIFKPLPKDDPLQRCPNIQLATDRLGWQPTVSIDKGLAKTIAYFSQEIISK